MTGLSNNHQSAPIGAALPPGAGQATAGMISYVIARTPGAKRRSGCGRRPGQSEARIDKTKRLIAALQSTPMTRDEIGNFLQYSPSGVRKYLADFRAAEILIVRDDLVDEDGQAVYGIVDDETTVAAFVAGLSKTRAGSGKRGRPTNLDIALGDKSRHIHVMADDTYYSVRLSRKPVAPDPLALPPNFFAPAAVQAEPVERRAAPRAPLPIPRFPSPQDCRLDLEVTA